MDIEQLGKIQRVEAPPFLFTRIQQRIENERMQRVSTGKVVALAFSFAVILIINTLVFVGAKSETNSTEMYANAINLTSTNTLYP